MRRLSSPSRRLLSSMASRWWPPALARRLVPPVRRVSSEATDGKLGGSVEDPRSASKGRTTEILIMEDEEEVSDIDYTVEVNGIPQSSHRDGSIYRGIRRSGWKRDYRVADRSETRLEAMMFSDPTKGMKDCCNMLQIFALELAKIPGDNGLVELYGYIAARDEVDMLLNYVVNISRNDPIIVAQGSLICMASGPRRGIGLANYTIIEYDMRIKRGRHERDDLQLIDGAIEFCFTSTWNRPFTINIRGDCGGAVDMTLACLHNAVEATVEVLISELHGSFNMSLRCFTSRFYKEIRLFDGIVTESYGLRKYVVAVMERSFIRLKFKVHAPSSSSKSKLCCTFKAKTNGHIAREIKTDFVVISVKVTWSTLPNSFPG
ncbi:hypothetical protein VPH35_098581 [Triticum aestivum]|uniref:uncharacterized protein n=1 Tax=Triticum aestivum TaxID=4565 RepID=UPI001D02E5CB|nr:uncharacterized protein LOC123125077 [Triticum aestivum]